MIRIILISCRCILKEIKNLSCKRRASALVAAGGWSRSNLISHISSRTPLFAAHLRSHALAVLYVAENSESGRISSPDPINFYLEEIGGIFFSANNIFSPSFQLSRFTTPLLHSESTHRCNGIGVELRRSPKGYTFSSHGNKTRPRIRARCIGTLP